MRKFFIIIDCVLLILLGSLPLQSQTARLLAGRYTDDGGKGLLLFDMNSATGGIKLISEADAGPNPSYFCFSKKHGLIYAANEVMEFNGIKSGGLTTLKYESSTGSIEKKDERPVPNGGPCYISLSSEEDFLFMANYMGGSVAVIKLGKDGIPVSITDTIIYNEESGKASHAHMIATNPSGERVYVTDLGLDRIMIYNLDHKTGKLDQIKNGIVNLAKGAGPRHFVFSNDGSKMYVICELNSTISAFSVSDNGELTPIQTISTLDKDFKGESFCADVHIGKSGKYLYGSNRGENTIVTFMVGEGGMLTPAGRTDCAGNWPRNFVVDPSGKYILVGNQKSGNISFLKIDENCGIPGKSVNDFKINSPACLKFLF
jgi:6-phosphogluconolactonase